MRNDWKREDALICDWNPEGGFGQKRAGREHCALELLCFESNISHINNSAREKTDRALCIQLRVDSTRASLHL